MKLLKVILILLTEFPERREMVLHSAHIDNVKNGGCQLQFMQRFVMYNCKNISGLPPLRRLSSLKKLHVESLPNWCIWAENEDSTLHTLRELVIGNCAHLRYLHATLPVLTKLEIDGSTSLICLPSLPSLHSLKVTDCGSWIWSSLCNQGSLSK